MVIPTRMVQVIDMKMLAAFTDVSTITYCEERWFDSFQSGRLVYSVFTFMVQVSSVKLC